MTKKDNIIRPLDSSFKLLILIFSISSIVFIFSLIWGIINDKYIDNLANLIAGFIVAPLGVISQSVLIAVGEVFTFSGCILGVNYAYQSKVKYLEMEIEKKQDKDDKDSN